MLLSTPFRDVHSAITLLEIGSPAVHFSSPLYPREEVTNNAFQHLSLHRPKPAGRQIPVRVFASLAVFLRSIMN